MRTAKTVETTDYAAMLRRMIRAYARRVASDGDVPDLADMLALRDQLDEAIRQTIADGDFTWQQVGDAAGCTRQAAQQRYRIKERAAA